MLEIKSLQVEKPWGNFRQFTDNSPCTVKIITVNGGEKLSLQSHSKRREFWRVIKGSGVIEIDGDRNDVNEGDERIIGINEKHRLEAGPLGIEVMEIAVGEFDEDDIIRYDDKYGRV
jgi:mannose-6-phosphate isomerase